MRIWFIPYCYLDSQRLQSQHLEVHSLLTVILKGKKWGRISDEFKHSCQNLLECHEKCVIEMEVRAAMKGRQSTHLTPIKTKDEIPLIHTSRPYKYSREQLINDVQQLRAKWEAEGYYFGVGRVDLRYVEKQLELPLGREWLDIVATRGLTRAFVRENREVMKTMGDKRLAQKLEILRSANAPLHA